MYSDSDDDVCVTVSEKQPSRTAQTEAAVSRSSSSAVAMVAEVSTPVQEVKITSMYDEKLPVLYLERCSVVVDFRRLLDGGDEKMVNPIVEGYLQTVHFPLCGEASVADKDYLGIWNKPHVSCKLLSRSAKQERLTVISQRVNYTHGIAPNISGVDEKTSKEKFYNYWIYLSDVSSRNSDPCYHYFMSNESTNKGQLKSSVEMYTRRALHCCKRDGVPEAVAFLTTEERFKEVKESLLWLESEGVLLPKYRVFSLKEVAGDAWNEYVTKVNFMADCRCNYHAFLDRNNHANLIPCCREMVYKLWEGLKQAGNLISSQTKAPMPIGETNLPIYEDEDDD